MIMVDTDPGLDRDRYAVRVRGADGGRPRSSGAGRACTGARRPTLAMTLGTGQPKFKST